MRRSQKRVLSFETMESRLSLSAVPPLPTDIHIVDPGLPPDPRPGEAVSYWHSDQLRQQLSVYLTDNPSHRYVGTVHSHPGGYAEPSGPDRHAFASTLRANPTMREAIFPIVVAESQDKLGAVLRFGQGHLVDLPHGTLAGYSAHEAAEGLVVLPAPMQVIPARSHCEQVLRPPQPWS